MKDLHRSARRFQGDLVKLLHEIGQHSRRPREVFESFVLLAACACAAGQREEEYIAEIGRWGVWEQKQFPECFALLVEAMDAEPFRDFLGPVHMELGSKSSQQWGGEFYTPREVNRMMSRVCLGNIEIPHDRPLTFCEPACGSGGMVLSTAEVFVEQGFSPLNMRATCVDVSRVAVNMCYVNLTLCGIPAEVIHGNTISLECWGGWRTIFWHAARGRGQACHPILDRLRELFALIPPEDQQETLEAVANATGQYELPLGERAG